MNECSDVHARTLIIRTTQVRETDPGTLRSLFASTEKEFPMRTSLTALAAIVVALSAGCSQPISPTGPTSVPSGATSITSSGANAIGAARPAAAGEKVPFKGSLEGIVTITPLTPPLASVLIEGTGNATQLGRFTVRIPHVVDQTVRIGSGTYEFIAANGDTLIADFTGQATLTSPGVLSITETATITGGTGRFAGATGSFTGARVFDVATMTTTGSFEGTISSPGASKH
jgi:hypothetical protein